ncbi:hypothetical protein NC651_007892 [Populus alba x Populus x berolinensis]|nr:hypothetical protein NC651_007892 [Populus alba x Populus x berolinensis]
MSDQSEQSLTKRTVFLCCITVHNRQTISIYIYKLRVLVKTRCTVCESCGFTVCTALRLCFSRFSRAVGVPALSSRLLRLPASFHRLCLVHVQIKAVWLVLGARGDVSRRVIICIGWDGFIKAVLLVCGGPAH